MDEPPSPASGQPAGGVPVSVNRSRDEDINGPTIPGGYAACRVRLQLTGLPLSVLNHWPLAMSSVKAGIASARVRPFACCKSPGANGAARPVLTAVSLFPRPFLTAPVSGRPVLSGSARTATRIINFIASHALL
ncbi:hypothetical protein [Pantoea allii]|uniref:hypothetical protein n=1 Tax=Pantoea allii TaxID=574096 RepID=UPI003D31A6E0